MVFCADAYMQGNAKTAGLEKDLGMEGTNDYNILLSIFFIPYVLTAPFLGILGKMYGPSRVLPCMMVSRIEGSNPRLKHQIASNLP